MPSVDWLTTTMPLLPTASTQQHNAEQCKDLYRGQRSWRSKVNHFLEDGLLKVLGNSAPAAEMDSARCNT